MGYSIRILPTAEKELASALEYLMTYSTNAASALLDEYENQLDLLQREIVSYSLSRLPELAQLGYHTALVNQYLFLYYLEDNCLVVAHFFHQKQDYASLVRSERNE